MELLILYTIPRIAQVHGDGGLCLRKHNSTAPDRPGAWGWWFADFPERILHVFSTNDFLKESHAREIDALVHCTILESMPAGAWDGVIISYNYHLKTIRKKKQPDLCLKRDSYAKKNGGFTLVARFYLL